MLACFTRWASQAWPVCNSFFLSIVSISSLKTQVHTCQGPFSPSAQKLILSEQGESESAWWSQKCLQMLLECLTSKDNCWGPRAATSAPSVTRHLEWIHIWKQNLYFYKTNYLVCEAFQDHTNAFAACIKCEFVAFPSNTLVLEFLNINKVWFLSVILSSEAQNNTSQISVTGKIFVV